MVVCLIVVYVWGDDGIFVEVLVNVIWFGYDFEIGVLFGLLIENGFINLLVYLVVLIVYWLMGVILLSDMLLNVLGWFFGVWVLFSGVVWLCLL